MKRKVLSTILAASMLATMVVGCGGGGDTQTSAPAADAGTEAPAEGGDSAPAEAPSGVAADKEGGKVGVAMPTQSSERWIKDGGNMKEKLEAMGYEVDLQYAEDDVQTQVSQI